MERRQWKPAYLELYETGELTRRASELYALFRACRLCPRQCGADRTQGETGVCGAGSRAKIAAAHPHFGEERPLVGRHGSGTIFFSHCNLLCVYCQNWPISHGGEGDELSDEEVGRVMIELQDAGCHNINVVTPTHSVPNIVAALGTAVQLGLQIPIVYNSSGYDPLEVVRRLEGIVDIYLADFKYTEPCQAERYSCGARDYPEVAEAAITEMHRQVGDLVTDEAGIALRGLMIRHLVLPNNVAGTDRLVRFVADKLSPSTYVNLMAQYRPVHEASVYPELSRRIARQEYLRAVAWARDAGLVNLDLGFC